MTRNPAVLSLKCRPGILERIRNPAFAGGDVMSFGGPHDIPYIEIGDVNFPAGFSVIVGKNPVIQVHQRTREVSGMNPVISAVDTAGQLMEVATHRGVWTAPRQPGNMNHMSTGHTDLTGNATTDILSQIPHIVDRARAGDRSAFTTLVNIFHGDIFRMVYYRTRSRMDAEDLTQDIFMKAFRMIAELRDAGRFKSWLYAIAVNGVHDFHRKKKLRALLGFAGPVNSSDIEDSPACEGCDASETMVRRDFWNAVKSFAEGLPRMEREVFLLRFMDDLSIRDITRVLGKNENTVKTHLYRAVAKFRLHGSLRDYCKKEGR